MDTERLIDAIAARVLRAVKARPRAAVSPYIRWQSLGGEYDEWVGRTHTPDLCFWIRSEAPSSYPAPPRYTLSADQVGHARRRVLQRRLPSIRAGKQRAKQELGRLAVEVRRHGAR